MPNTCTGAAKRLRDVLADWPARAPVDGIAYILNPLDYAWDNHKAYCDRYAPAGHHVEAVLLGMNPGPWGMAQTGVPFGSPDYVANFLDIHGAVTPPARCHPKRPVTGFAGGRTEVSGQRFWGGIEKCFGSAESFFARFFIANYCPLVFQSKTGANLTPDKISAHLWDKMRPACDEHLAAVVTALRPRTLIGVGAWATKQARRVVDEAHLHVAVGTILHPSPASPAANRGWLTQARKQLAALGHPWPAP